MRVTPALLALLLLAALRADAQSVRVTGEVRNPSNQLANATITVSKIDDTFIREIKTTDGTFSFEVDEVVFKIDVDVDNCSPAVQTLSAVERGSTLQLKIKTLLPGQLNLLMPRGAARAALMDWSKRHRDRDHHDVRARKLLIAYRIAEINQRYLPALTMLEGAKEKSANATRRAELEALIKNTQAERDELLKRTRSYTTTLPVARLDLGSAFQHFDLKLAPEVDLSALRKRINLVRRN